MEPEPSRTENAATSPSAEEPGFEAFISYRRVDGARHARWLRNKLLYYRLPAGLTPGAARRPAIYLDTIYERATEDFFEGTIKPALARSAFLVLVRTPGTLQARKDGSPNWVEREIDFFATTPQGRHGNVAVAWAKGAPGDPLPGRLLERFANIEIVDLSGLSWLRLIWWPRQWKLDGEVLKIIATVRGVPAEKMPELRQEESRRQLRRAAISIAAAAVVVALLAGLAVWALLLLVESRRQLVNYTTLQGRYFFEQSPARARLNFARAVEIEQSGHWLNRLTGIDAGTARLWLGQAYPPQVETILWHPKAVKSVRYSPDGARVATGCVDGSARVWEVASGKLIHTLPHTAQVNWVEFSPTGDWIATASSDQTARVWDAKTGLPRTPPLQHKHVVMRARFDQAGARLLTASLDDTAAVWDSATGKILAGPMVHSRSDQRGLNDAVFSPDGATMATAGFDGNARLWKTATGSPADIPSLVHRDVVSSVAFSPDGARLVTASEDRTAIVWEVATGARAGNPIAHAASVNSACFSPDGDAILTACSDGTAKISDPVTGNRFAAVSPMALRDVLSFAIFSPDGSRIMTGGYSGWTQVWDSATGSPLGNPIEHGGLALAADCSPDGQWMASAAFDGTVRISRLPTTRDFAIEVRHEYQILDTAFAAEDILISTALGGRCGFWNVKTGERRAPEVELEANAKQIALDRAGARFVPTSGAGRTQVHSTTDGSALTPWLEHGSEILSAAFDPTESLVATAGEDGVVKLWNAQTGAAVGQPMKHEGPVAQVCFHPSNGSLVTASAAGSVQLWETGSGVARTPPRSFGKALKSAVFCAEGQRLLVVPDDGPTAYLLDAKLSGPPVAELAHRDAITAARLNAAGTRIVTLGVDHQLCVWDARTGKILSRLADQDFFDATISNDGRRLLTAGLGGLQLWDVATGEKIGRAAGRDTSMLTAVFNGDETRIAGGSRVGAVAIVPLTSFRGSAEAARIEAEVASASTMEPRSGVTRPLSSVEWLERAALLKAPGQK